MSDEVKKEKNGNFNLNGIEGQKDIVYMIRKAGYNPTQVD